MVRKSILYLVGICFFFSWLPSGHVAAATESKWQDEIIYFLMIDRFNDGDVSNDYQVNPDDPYAFHGGDIKGIIDKLDYIKSFGFTAIWITPVVQNASKGYHGYWAEDFYKVDKHFGTLADMKKLVQEAHKRGMKIILDQVVNHVATDNPWLTDASKKDWFHPKQEITNWNDPTQLVNGWLMGLPDLNTENPEVKTYLIDMAKWWIKETDIDGFRLDTVKHVSKEFWTEFAKEVKSVKKDFYLIGEVWEENPSIIASYQSTGIDSFMNFPYYNAITEVFVRPDRSIKPLFNVWERDKQTYENPYMMGTFLDNHDVERFVRQAKLNNQYPPSRLKLALTYLYASPGIPIVYYGTEIALDGGKDPDNRRQMDFKLDENFSAYVKKLAEVRTQLPSLRRGDFEMLIDKDGLGVFKRTYQNQTSIIIINNTTKDQTVHLTPEQLPTGKQLNGLLEDDIIRGTKDGYSIFIKREKANIYAWNERSGLNMPFIIAIVSVYVLFMVFLVLLFKRRKRTVS